jgi:hypothetical protein
VEFNIEADQAGARLREGVRAHTLLVGDRDATAMINGDRVQLQRLALTIAHAAGLKIGLDGHIDGNAAYIELYDEHMESHAECQRMAKELRSVANAVPSGGTESLLDEVRALVTKLLQSESDYKVASDALRHAVEACGHLRDALERTRAQLKLKSTDECGEPPAEAVNAVMAAWAHCHPHGDATSTLRQAGSSALHDTRNLARLAAAATLESREVRP